MSNTCAYAMYCPPDLSLIKHYDSRGQAPTIRIDTPIDEGDVLPILGGLKAIFTPGHMSLYHIPSKTLITGDAAVARDGKLLGPNEAFTPDLKLAWKSFARFVDFDFKRALCFHGGLCDKRSMSKFVCSRNRRKKPELRWKHAGAPFKQSESAGESAQRLPGFCSILKELFSETMRLNTFFSSVESLKSTLK